MLRFQSHQHTSGSSDKTGGFNTISTFSYRVTYYGFLYLFSDSDFSTFSLNSLREQADQEQRGTKTLSVRDEKQDLLAVDLGSTCFLYVCGIALLGSAKRP